jgi:hypothetical protein
MLESWHNFFPRSRCRSRPRRNPSIARTTESTSLKRARARPWQLDHLRDRNHDVIYRTSSSEPMVLPSVGASASEWSPSAGWRAHRSPHASHRSPASSPGSHTSGEIAPRRATKRSHSRNPSALHRRFHRANAFLPHSSATWRFQSATSSRENARGWSGSRGRFCARGDRKGRGGKWDGEPHGTLLSCTYAAPPRAHGRAAHRDRAYASPARLDRNRAAATSH